MHVPVNQVTLAGGVEWLVGDSRPSRGVELAVGRANEPESDVCGWLSPAQAELLALALFHAARRVRTEQERERGYKAPVDIMEFIGE